MADTIRVDTEALRGLSDRCMLIASRLESLGASVFDADRGVLGDAGLAGELEHFHDAWSDRRALLSETLDKAALALDDVAFSFEEADSNLSGPD